MVLVERPIHAFATVADITGPHDYSIVALTFDIQKPSAKNSTQIAWGRRGK